MVKAAIELIPSVEIRQPNAIAERLRSERNLYAAGSDERLLPADEMLAQVEESFSALGITRLGRLTGLDRVGIPVWMAVRPNSANLSVSQGKGLDDETAAVSAAMEAAELALAERLIPGSFLASPAEIQRSGGLVFPGERYLRLGHSLPGVSEAQRWIEGYDLLSNEAVFIPEEAVGFVDRSDTTYWQSSDGFGAGASLTEAAVHGICELIERDAMAIWSFRTAAEMATREVDPLQLVGWGMELIVETADAAGLRLRLFDITTNLKVACFLATVSPVVPNGIEHHHLELSSGTDAHPLAVKAAQQAILEALQSRLTAIAGARDDIDAQQYRRPPDGNLRFYFGEGQGGSADIGISAETREMSPPEQLDWLLMRLRQARIGSAMLVSMNADAFGFSVGKMFIPELEQHPGTRNRRLGRRGLAAMMGQR